MRFPGRFGATKYENNVDYEGRDDDDPSSDKETGDNAVNRAKYEMSSVTLSAKKIILITSSRIVYSTLTLVFLILLVSF